VLSTATHHRILVAILSSLGLVAGCETGDPIGGPGDGDGDGDTGVDAGAPDSGGDPGPGNGAIRLIEPLNGDVVASLRPTFRWEPADTEVTIELCGDRECTVVAASMTATGGSASFANCLGIGSFFWRAIPLDDTSGLTGAVGFTIALGEPGTFRAPAGALTRPAEGGAGFEALALADGRALLLDQGNTPEIFEPWCETFSESQPMLQARRRFAAALMADGRVLISGGIIGADSYSAATEIFDPATGTFSAGPDLVVPRTGHTATALGDGRILVAGGNGPAEPGSSHTALTSAEIYDPSTGAFRLIGSMAIDHTDHAAVRLAGDEVLIAGGAHPQSSGGGARADADLFDPETETFTATGPMTGPRAELELTVLSDGRALASGGQSSGTSITTLEVYDPAAGAFSTVAELPAGSSSLRAGGLADGRVLLIGGGDGAAYLYGGGEVSTAGPMMQARFRPGVALLRNGRVLIAGGAAAGAMPLAEVFVP
jgi:hypothetical protein